jgi:hypothetical protein
LPISDVTQVKEGGKPVSMSRGPKFQEMDARRTVFLLPSGDYSFTGPLDAPQFIIGKRK